MNTADVEVGGKVLDPDADFFATSELAVPPATPDVHFGTIEAVYLKTIENEDWPAQFVVKVKSSSDTTVEDDYSMVLPKGFYDNVQVDATTLPEKAQTSYRISIANSDQTANLQELRKLAKEGGRTSQTVEGLIKNPTTIEEFVQNHAMLLNGLEIAFYRNVDKKAEPRFKNKLRVQGIISREAAANPKAFKKGGYVKVFEQQ